MLPSYRCYLSLSPSYFFSLCSTLGTPDESIWPGVTTLPDYKPLFPRWPARSISCIVPKLDPLGVDLLSKMLQYQPSKRISAKQAMQHPWFDDLDKSAL
jgi:cyclin-dependent kinase 2